MLPILNLMNECFFLVKTQICYQDKSFYLQGKINTKLQIRSYNKVPTLTDEHEKIAPLGKKLIQIILLFVDHMVIHSCSNYEGLRKQLFVFNKYNKM